MIGTLQTHHVYSTQKRRRNDRFHVVSTWNTRGVFVGNSSVFTFMVTFFLKKNGCFDMFSTLIVNPFLFLKSFFVFLVSYKVVYSLSSGCCSWFFWKFLFLLFLFHLFLILFVLVLLSFFCFLYSTETRWNSDVICILLVNVYLVT